MKGSDYQGLERFISSSLWDHHSLMDQVACDANTLFGDEKLAGLYIDESSFLKKGHASVGVQRQWSGRARLKTAKSESTLAWGAIRRCA
ncbi:MAG: transposase [Candidatus Synoicihabitans palmerolidicus]|nr:transposase [Candidatus Synoicihabitans palmerolidicus]